MAPSDSSVSNSLADRARIGHVGGEPAAGAALFLDRFGRVFKSPRFPCDNHDIGAGLCQTDREAGPYAAARAGDESGLAVEAEEPLKHGPGATRPLSRARLQNHRVAWRPGRIADTVTSCLSPPDDPSCPVLCLHKISVSIPCTAPDTFPRPPVRPGALTIGSIRSSQ